MSGHYRVKNVVVVMEWLVDPGQVRRSSFKQTGFREGQEARLKHSFDAFDVEQKQSLGPTQLKELLLALDVPFSGEEGEIEGWMKQLDINKDGRLDFNEVKQLMLTQAYTSRQE